MSLKRFPHGSTGQHLAAFGAAPSPDLHSGREEGSAGERIFAAPAVRPTVILFGRVGDMVMVSALLRYLHQRYHQPCFLLGAGPWNSPLFAGHSDVARVWSFPRHAPFFVSRAWWSALWSLHRSDPGPIYVCERQPRQLARVRRLLALGGVNPGRCLFIADAEADGEQHWVDRFLRFGARTPPALHASDYPLPLPQRVPGPHLQVLDSERADRNEWLHAQGWSGRPVILVQPGNRRSMSKSRDRWRLLNADDKLWPTANWVGLLHRIHAHLPEALLVLCGAPQEGAMLREIRSATGLPALVVAELPLRRLLALCEGAHSMVSVDTGPAHAAAALGLPLVVLFGAESQGRWLPRSPCGSPVLGVGGPPTSSRVDQISVEDVFSAWCALLARMRPRSAEQTACEGN
ncbi:MAG TPA: glycosyltransferase family 9 protein [Steroidobacteraceae bacterium]|nr:glycosyltransferase family 9 protein [Steroidobacteraceae bacterium]